MDGRIDSFGSHASDTSPVVLKSFGSHASDTSPVVLKSFGSHASDTSPVVLKPFAPDTSVCTWQMCFDDENSCLRSCLQSAGDRLKQQLRKRVAQAGIARQGLPDTDTVSVRVKAAMYKNCSEVVMKMAVLIVAQLQADLHMQ